MLSICSPDYAFIGPGKYIHKQNLYSFLSTSLVAQCYKYVCTGKRDRVLCFYFSCMCIANYA